MKEHIPVIKIDDVSRVVTNDAFTFGRRVKRRIYFLQDNGTTALCVELDANDVRSVSIGAAEAAGQQWTEASLDAAPLPPHGIPQLRDAGRELLHLIDAFRQGPDQNVRSLLGLVGMEAVALMPKAQQARWLKEMELSAEFAARMFAAELEAGMGPSEPEIGKVVS